MNDSKLDNSTMVCEPSRLRISIATNTMAGVTISEMLQRFEDVLRGHGYVFSGSLDLVDQEEV